MHDLSELLRAIAWPAVVLYVVNKFKQPIADMLAKLAHRIETAKEVSLGPKGLQLTGEVVQNTARLDALEIIVQKAAPPAPGPELVKSLASAPPAAIPAELAALAEAYRDVRISDYAGRVRRKDDLANEMATLATAAKLPRDLLAASEDEGIIVALATLIINEPQREDVGRWLAAAPKVSLKHVAYRMVVALTRLITLRLLLPVDLVAAWSALQRMRSFADPSLLAVIGRAELLIDLNSLGASPPT